MGYPQRPNGFELVAAHTTVRARFRDDKSKSTQ